MWAKASTSRPAAQKPHLVPLVLDCEGVSQPGARLEISHRWLPIWLRREGERVGRQQPMPSTCWAATFCTPALPEPPPLH